jgi:threonine/homoserine/homoserine lactone efflux protein
MELLPFLAVSAVIAVVPGVDMALITQQVLMRGRRAGLFAVAGIATGSGVQAAAAAVGLSALLAASEPAFAAVKFAGAAYLLWLGARTLWRARRAGHDASAIGSPETVNPSSWRSYRSGLLTNLLNPKIIVFYVTFLPQFVDPGPGAVARTALLAALFLVVACSWLLVYVVLLQRLRGVLSREAVRRRIEQATGAVLVGLGVRLAVEH